MKPKWRVLSVIDDLGLGGDENRLLSFAQTIDRSRFEHRILTIHREDPCAIQSFAMRRQYADARVALNDLGESRAIRDGRKRGPLHLLGASQRLVRKVVKLHHAMIDFKADLVDAHLDSANFLSVLAALTLRVPCTVTLYHARPTMTFPFWRAVGQFTLSRADTILTDSEVRAEEIRQWVFRSKRRVSVIPNGIAPPTAARSSTEIMRILNLDVERDTRIIGQISGLVPHKGHTDLLRAARIVLQRRPNTYFLIVGYERDTPGYKAALQSEAEKLGIASRVRIVSYPGPIGDIWQIIDIHAHASHFDSLPNAIIEGMALGKPAVVTAVGGVPELVESGSTGLVVPVNCPEAFAAALLEIAENDDMARRLGTAAYQRYLEGYRPRVMTDRLEELFESIIQMRVREEPIGLRRGRSQGARRFEHEHDAI